MPGDATVAPLVSVDHDGIVVSAVKLADDAGADPGGDVVVRVYEALGARASGRLVPGFAVSSVVVTDLLERPLAGADPAGGSAADLDDDGGVALRLRPFQVLTLRLTRSVS